VHINRGFYNPIALAVLSVAILVAGRVCLRPPIQWIERLSTTAVFAILGSAAAVEIVLLWSTVGENTVVTWGVVGLGILGVVQAARLGPWRRMCVTTLLVLFAIVASSSFLRDPTPNIDVLMFQQTGAAWLLHGKNPYAARYPNLYEADTTFYGPGVVGPDNRLTVGLPYPPLSLLMTLPAYVAGGDSRFADVVAIAAAAGLMFFARPSRWTGMIAALYLLTPRVLYVIEYAWTEALFAFSFSLLMFCAVRWRRGLPYALGIFLATKQYSIFALPFLPLLFGGADAWRSAARALGIAAIVAAAVTVPFVIWDPYAFWRSIVEFQVVQPLRVDALSHVVWIHKYFPRVPLQQALPFVALVAAMAVAVWCGRPTPAYFAGALAFVQLIFFALSKQAFANYYYYVIATMWWGAAAAVTRDEEVRAAPQPAL